MVAYVVLFGICILLVRTMRPSFSGEASLGLAQDNREEGLLSKEARLAVLFEEHVRREACMAQSRLTPSRTPTQPSSLAAEAAIPYQGRDSRRSTLHGQNRLQQSLHMLNQGTDPQATPLTHSPDHQAGPSLLKYLPVISRCVMGKPYFLWATPRQ